MSFCASCSLKRATVCLFHSSGSRSAFAASGGPSSPGVGPSSSFSLVPELRLLTISASDPPAPCVCIPSILSMRRNKPPPSNARLPPFKMSRRFRFMVPPCSCETRTREQQLQGQHLFVGRVLLTARNYFCPVTSVHSRSP